MANRHNLRIGIVKDRDLVTLMVKNYPEFYLMNSSSIMVLRRYDGEIVKKNLSDL